MIIQDYVKTLGSAAAEASKLLARATSEAKDNTLALIAEQLDSDRHLIISANELDLKEAQSHGLDPAMIERLLLGHKQVDQMLEGLHQVIGLTDPVGEETDMGRRPSGIELKKLRVPLGVIGIIYESRPNVTIDAASLCLKAGNACILRGGSEAINSNRSIGVSIQTALSRCFIIGILLSLVIFSMSPLPPRGIIMSIQLEGDSNSETTLRSEVSTICIEATGREDLDKAV